MTFFFTPFVLFALLIVGTQANASEAVQHNRPNAPLPKPIECYQTGSNAKNIDLYMSCFTKDALMIDVSRRFRGVDTIKTWALREVISSGETFHHRRVLEQADSYAKTEVNWMSWVVHYSYWWDSDDKITKMSLQYAN